MHKQTKHAVRRVLREARCKEDFWDYSDAERSVWLMGRAFELGLRQRANPLAKHPHAAGRRGG